MRCKATAPRPEQHIRGVIAQPAIGRRRWLDLLRVEADIIRQAHEFVHQLDGLLESPGAG